MSTTRRPNTHENGRYEPPPTPLPTMNAISGTLNTFRVTFSYRAIRSLHTRSVRITMNFLEFQSDVLHCLGIFPFCTTSKWKSWVFNIYRVLVFGLLASVVLLMTVQLCVAPDLSVLARTIDIWTTFVSGLYKWLCMNMFNEDFANLKTTLIKIQGQGSIAYGSSASADQITKNYLKRTKRLTCWYLFFGMITTFLLTTNPFLTYAQRDRSDFEYFNDPKSYPFMIWIPFAVNDKWTFITIFTSQALALTLIVMIYLGIDSYMFGSIYSIGGQIELLNSSINNIGNILATADNKSLCEKKEVMNFNEEQQHRCYYILRECAKHHIQIRFYIRDIRIQFSSLIIVDYVHGVTSLSFALFQLSNSVGVGEWVSLLSYILVSTSHQFLNNYFGEFIIQKQLSIYSALYHVQWWRANKKIRSILTLMIMRSMNLNFITGFYMYKLCNESFLKFVKALYTYYMVLRRINANDKQL